MSSISSISPMQQIASGQRINSAADDAAGLAISEKLKSQVTSANKNIENIATMDNALRTAEGSFGSIQDSLGRIRELAVQASNGILSDDDKQIVQNEINQLKEGISSVASNTEFNNIKLLDGSFTNRNVAMNAQGTGSSITIENTSLETLGIKDFDVTKDFDISSIDDALTKVSEARSKLGSASNAFEHASASIAVKAENLTSARSNITDADIGRQVSVLKRNQVLDQYKMFTQQAIQQQKTHFVGQMTDFLI